jgi:hypothetical protein
MASQVTSPDPARQLLRHIVATLAYRAGKTLRGAPDEFAGFQASPTSRTPGQILAHLGDLMDWAFSITAGRQKWHDSEPLPWRQEVSRFFQAVEAFDAYLASDQPVQVEPGKLFQGGIADALTHVGQIAMLRRMAGCPVRGENYFMANIAPGRVGFDQAAPVKEFD